MENIEYNIVVNDNGSKVIKGFRDTVKDSKTTTDETSKSLTGLGTSAAVAGPKVAGLSGNVGAFMGSSKSAIEHVKGLSGSIGGLVSAFMAGNFTAIPGAISKIGTEFKDLVAQTLVVKSSLGVLPAIAGAGSVGLITLGSAMTGFGSSTAAANKTFKELPKALAWLNESPKDAKIALNALGKEFKNLAGAPSSGVAAGLDQIRKGSENVAGTATKATGSVGFLAKAFAVLGSPIVIAVAAVAAFLAVLVPSIKAAIEAQEVVMRLANALELVGIRYEDVESKIDVFADAVLKSTRFSDEQAREAITSLLLYVDTYEEAQRGAQLAINMSSRTQLDLATSSRLVGMAMAGSIQMLGRYIPELRKAGELFSDFATQADKSRWALEMLEYKFGSASTKDVNTLTGAWIQFKNQLGEMFEKIGSVFLPVLQKFIQALTGIITAINWVLTNIGKAASWLGEQIVKPFEDQARREAAGVVTEENRYIGKVPTYVAGAPKVAYELSPEYKRSLELQKEIAAIGFQTIDQKIKQLNLEREISIKTEMGKINEENRVNVMKNVNLLNEKYNKLIEEAWKVEGDRTKDLYTDFAKVLAEADKLSEEGKMEDWRDSLDFIQKGWIRVNGELREVGAWLNADQVLQLDVAFQKVIYDVERLIELGEMSDWRESLEKAIPKGYMEVGGKRKRISETGVGGTQEVAAGDLANLQKTYGLITNDIQLQSVAAQTLLNIELNRITYLQGVDPLLRTQLATITKQIAAYEQLKLTGTTLQGLSEGFKDYTKQMGSEFTQMENLAKGLTSGMEGAFMGFFNNILDSGTTMAEKLQKLFKDLANSIISELAKALIVKPVVSAISTGITALLKLAEGGVTGPLLAHYPIHAYQGGGIASSPQIGIFGEGGGQEAFVPLKHGKIPVETKGNGKGGDTINYNTYIQATDVDSFSKLYGPAIESIYYRGKRFNKVAMRQ